MRWESNQYLYNKIHEFQGKYPNFSFESITNFCTEHNINLIGYSQFNKSCMKRSNDGFTFFDAGEYTIFYNVNKPVQRKRFTIAHEIGHIFLEHHKLLNIKQLNNSNNYKYKNVPIWEYQANVFAHNVLLPASLAKTLNGYDHVVIAKKLNLSIAMVDFRYTKLKEDLFYLKKYAN